MNDRGLTPRQIALLHSTLVAKRARLLRDLARLDDERTEGMVDSAEMEDVAEGVIEDRERAAMVEHDRELLAEVDRALSKFDAGVYGMSELSGRMMSFERLRSVPWARYDADEGDRVARGLD